MPNPFVYYGLPGSLGPRPAIEHLVEVYAVAFNYAVRRCLFLRGACLACGVARVASRPWLYKLAVRTGSRPPYFFVERV